MHKRWCIIAGARSGSTWLENIIYDSMGMLPAKIKLGEYLLQTPQSFDYELDQNNNIIETPHKFTMKSSYNFLKQRTHLVSVSNIDQALTMRIFVRLMQLPNFDYATFLSTLIDRNFKMISLYRNIFDKSISWYFMEHTGNIHRWISDSDTGYYSTTQGIKDWSRVPSLEPITVDISRWKTTLWASYQDEIERKKMASLLNCPTINYETLIKDCSTVNIEVTPVSIVKTYDISYKDCILNYDELLDKYNYYKNMVGYED